MLACEGHLNSFEDLWLNNVDITDIPTEQMGKLTSIATESVKIINMTPTNHLGNILANVKTRQVHLEKMALSEADTRALVTAMRNGVVEVSMDYTTLDIEELTKYDGRGH